MLTRPRTTMVKAPLSVLCSSCCSNHAIPNSCTSSCSTRRVCPQAKRQFGKRSMASQASPAPLMTQQSKSLPPMSSLTSTSQQPSRGKKEGDISSVFTSLSSDPNIPPPPLDSRFAEVKRQLIRGRENAVQDSFHRLLRRLRVENKRVAEMGSEVIPQIEFSDILAARSGKGSVCERARLMEFEDEVKLRGSAVIRGVVSREEARGYKEEVEEYVRINPWTKAFPAKAPAVFELYWSPSQVKARSHANLLDASRYMMEAMWHSASTTAPISTSHPLAYADRVRIRQPGDSGFALGPHVDGGSVERWEPTGYGLGRVYDKIFSGRWEEYDAWESSCRLPVVSDLYQGPGACSMFRMFQGWLSMSNTAPNEGTLKVNPLLPLSTAYFLLRPFFTPIKLRDTKMEQETGQTDVEYLHEDNWVLESEMSSSIQGAAPAVSQEMNDVLHPHLDLEKTMVHVPEIQPGDFVLWHCDTIHAVDKVHAGRSDSSVLYIPVCPLTDSNISYLHRQREHFLSGHPGPDFPGGKGESEHAGRPTAGYITQQGRGNEALQAMGLAGFDVGNVTTTGEQRLVERANKTLGF